MVFLLHGVIKLDSITRLYRRPTYGVLHADFQARVEGEEDSPYIPANEGESKSVSHAQRMIARIAPLHRIDCI